MFTISYACISVRFVEDFINGTKFHPFWIALGSKHAQRSGQMLDHSLMHDFSALSWFQE